LFGEKGWMPPGPLGAPPPIAAPPPPPTAETPRSPMMPLNPRTLPKMKLPQQGPKVKQ
jgi:hypothetical protein